MDQQTNVSPHAVLYALVDFAYRAGPPDDGVLRVLHACLRIDNEIRNGGFGQAFFNLNLSPRGMAKALERVGAQTQAELCLGTHETFIENKEAFLRAMRDDGMSDEFSRVLGQFEASSMAYLKCDDSVPVHAARFLQDHIERPSIVAILNDSGFSSAPVSGSYMNDACNKAIVPWVEELLADGHSANAPTEVEVDQLVEDALADSFFSSFSHEAKQAHASHLRSSLKDPPLAVVLKGIFKGQLAARRRIVGLLLDAGADPNALRSHGIPVVFDAASDHQMFKRFEQAGADLYARCYRDRTLLHDACDPAVAERLLDLGLDANDRACGVSPLLSLAIRPSTERRTLEVLIHGGADVVDVGPGRTLLEAAGGDTDFMTFLAKLGAPLNPPLAPTGGFQWGPLHWAAERGYAATVQAMLTLGAKADVPLAVDVQRYKHLFAKGATPAQIARQAGHESCAALLEGA